MKQSELNILIVEDNISFTLDLEMMLDELGYQEVKSVDNAADALEYIFSQSPDLILMDIDIKGNMNGTEIGAKISHMKIPIIYLTSFNDPIHYEAAKKSNIAGYLIKPTSKFTLAATIDQAFGQTTKNEEQPKGDPIANPNPSNVEFDESIFIKKNKVYHKIPIKDIQHVEASGNYTYLYQGKEKFISNLKFSQIEAMLPTTLFIKVHRSFIINLNYFNSINIEENTIRMEDGAIISVSRNNKQKLLDRMKIG